MGASQQTKTEDSTSTRSPYAPAMQNVQSILDNSYNLYSAGVGAGAYQGDRVAGLGGRSQAGLDDLWANRNAGQGAAQAGDTYLQGLLGNGGQTTGGQSAVQGLLGVGPANTAGLQAAANASTGYQPVAYNAASISPVSTTGLSRVNPNVSTTGLQNAARELSNNNSLDNRVARQLAGGTYNLDSSGYDGLNAGLAGPTQVAKSLQDVADGRFLREGGNPYLESQISQTNQDAGQAVKQAMAASGRYGSGMFQSALGGALARNESTLRYNDYSTERDRQAQAAQAIDQGLLSRTAARQGLYDSSNNVRTANANQALQGAQIDQASDLAALTGQQSVFNARGANADRSLQQQQAIANLGVQNNAQSLSAQNANSAGLLSAQNANNAGALAAYQAALQGQQAGFNANVANNAQQIGQYGTALQAAQGDRAAAMSGLGSIAGVQSALQQPGRTAVGVGAAQDAAHQQELDANMALFNERNTNPWRALGLLQGSTMPIASTFGTATSHGTATATEDPGLLNTIVGAISGLSGGAANLGKGLPALMALSDERVKENIRRIGKTDDGQPIYSFNFKGDPQTQTGLLAQEVAEKHPEAVVQGSDGLLRVDYEKATDDAAEKAAGGKRGRRPPPSDADRKDALAEMIGKLLMRQGALAHV